MLFFIINCIKINCFFLEFEDTESYNNQIVNFIIKLDLRTKLLVIVGSFFFFLFYKSLFFLSKKKIKMQMFQNTPLINKIFHFYRKIILLKYYED